MLGTTYDLRKYKKIAVGTGALTLIGCIYYEYYRIKKLFKGLVNPDVLDIDKKRPDYIYIKYSIYRESMDQIKNMEEQDKNWVNVIVHPVGKWWKTIKHSVAWRLLEIARDGDLYDRLKAVHQLARIDNLKDWDYQHLAQICDYRTGISLARNLCDTRWFLPPRAKNATKHPKTLIFELSKHLEPLRDNQCVCFHYKKSLQHFNILSGYDYMPDYLPNGTCYVTKLEMECFKQCLDVLFHITKNPDSVRRMIRSGILDTLIEIEKLFKHNADMRFQLSKIMANMSICRDFAYDFFVTGWVGILAHWSRNQDLRVQVTAAKALANMDIDDSTSVEYQPSIYPLYPRGRVRQKLDADIVFIHGLLGGVFVTWRQKDRTEPQLGLYGKNAFFTEEPDDIFMVGAHINSSAVPHSRRKNNKVYVSKINDKIVNEKDDALIYDESALVGTKPTKPKKVDISDTATKELVETLQTAIEINPDWEVVFPDCPVQGKFDSNDNRGPYSVSGEKWLNEKRNIDYTFCWPMDWLPDDYPNIRVIGVNYETSLSEWSSRSPNCPCEKKGTLHNRAWELLHSLVASGVGRDRPIIWVGHSMGGLLLKSIIIQSRESTDSNIKKLADNTQAILFLGTPHRGSSVANLKQHLQYIVSPTIEVKELQENGTYLLKLHEKFLTYIEQFKSDVKIVSVAEGIPTVLTALKLPFHVVPEESANINFGDFYVLNIDHLGLSKPFVRQSFLYQRLLRIINEVISEKRMKIEK